MPPPRPSSAELAHEREVLEEMLISEGWTVFVRQVQKVWRGDGYFAAMARALQTSDPGVEAKVVHKTSIEVENMVKWPVDRVTQLKGSVE